MPKRHNTVLSPSSGVHAYRDVDCLFALMPVFRELVQTAEEAGWTEEEVASSLLTLAYVHGNKRSEYAALWH